MKKQRELNRLLKEDLNYVLHPVLNWAFKGGNEIAHACSDYIRKVGKLSQGDAFLSPAGRLKSKFVIHVVGPVWKGGNDKEEDQLTEAVFRAMMQASRKNLSSIALPAISCGVYSFPVKRATAVIAAAVKNFFRKERESSLRKVYLCDVMVNTVEAFTEALVGEFGQGSVTRYQQQTAAYRPPSRIHGALCGLPYVSESRPVRNRPKKRISVDQNEVTFTIYAMEEATIYQAIAQLDSALDKMGYINKC